MTQHGDQRARELEVLAESSRLLTSTLDLDQVLRRLVGIARARLAVDFVRLWLLDESGEILELRAQDGQIRHPELDQPSLPARDSLAGWVVANGEAVSLVDVRGDARLQNRAWFNAEGFASALCVPILLDERAMGLLSCLSRSRREFTPAEMSLAQALTAPAVAAVRNAALYAEALGRLEEIQAFQRVASETLSSPELETALRAVVREMRSLLRSDAALCTLVDPTTGRMRRLFGSGVPAESIPGYSPETGEGVTGLAARERRPVRSSDYLTDSRFTRSPIVEEWAREQQVTSFIAAPVIDAAGSIIAFLGAFNRTPRPFTARHETMLVALGQQAALAIGKADSFEEERRRARQTAALLDIASACTSTIELTPLLKTIALQTAQAVGGDGCALFLWNGATLVPVMAQFADGHVDLVLWNRFKSLPAQTLDDLPTHAAAVRSRQPVIVGRSQGAPPDVWFDAFDIASAVIVPLVSKDEVVGTMALIHYGEHRWRQDQLDLAMTIAAQISLAVDTARHYKEARQRAIEVGMLAAVGETLTSTLDLQEVLDGVAGSAAAIVGAQRAVVYELDAAANALCARAMRGIAIEPGLSLRLGQGAAGVAAERRAPVRIPDVQAEPLAGGDQIHEPTGMPVGDVARAHGFRGVLAVPMVSRETTLGAVCIYWDEPHEADEREVRLLSALARHAAIAIDNARLVGDLRRTLDDLRAAQETLVRGATLRAVGELAAGAAHHLNNLMAVVLGRTQLLIMKTEDPAIVASLRSIERAATDAAETVVRIQSFSRTARRGEAALFDANAAIEEAIEFTRSRWQDEAQVHGAPIEMVFERGVVPEVSGRGVEIREVLTNLILNAVDALPKGGRIVVTTRAEEGRLVVSVKDSGVGMPEDVKRRAFEPFFTTKGVKQTGLGLAVAYGIVRRHGGQVLLESEEGRGTTVTFWLPAAEPAVATASVAPRSDKVGSILVIDDEPDVRELVADVLSGRGHNITVAGDGRAGLMRFETGHYDLVITDLGMPDLTGWDVARAIKMSRHEVPVLLLTGWADAVDPEEQARVDGIIKKPFDLKQFVAAVNVALAHGQ